MTALHLNDRPTAVYRLFAEDGTLLYVGCSCDPTSRVDHDHLYKDWGPDVADVTAEWFGSRLPALKHEALAIIEESPRYNIRRTHPDRIRLAERARTTVADRPRFTFEEAADEVDVPVHWLWFGVAKSKLPHSCSGPTGSDVWFDSDDIRDLHTIYDFAPDDVRRRSARASVYRFARLKRCAHAAA